MANFISNFFDSIFGSRPATQPTSTTTQTSSASLPAEVAPFAKEALGEAQRLYQMRGQQGFIPYTGEQLAEFTPDQLKAFQGISSLVGTGQQYFDPASRLAASSAIAPTAENVQQFMNPYMQNVVDIQQREAKRQADIAANQLAGQAVTGAGGYGGSRQAILEAELARNTQQQLGDIQAKGIASAYEDAQQRLAQQRAREAGAANIFGQLGTQVPATTIQELSALQGVGGVQQAQKQAGLDIAKQQFQQEQAFPEQQLSNYMNFIRGTPTATNVASTTTTATAAPSYLQQLAGLGIGAAGLYNAFGGFKPSAGGSGFSLFGNTGGKVGGLSSIVVKRSKGGPMRLQVGGNVGSDMTEEDLKSWIEANPEQASMLYGSLSSNQPLMTRPAGIPSVDYNPADVNSQRAAAIALQGLNRNPAYEAAGRAYIAQQLRANKQMRDIANQRAVAAEKYGAETPSEGELYRMLADRRSALQSQGKDVESEMEQRRKNLESQKYLELANIGFRLASPEGSSRGFAQDLARSLAPSTKVFGDIKEREAELARQKRLELEGLSDKQLDLLFKSAGLDKEKGQRVYQSTIEGLAAKEKAAGLDAATAKAGFDIAGGLSKDERERANIAAGLSGNLASAEARRATLAAEKVPSLSDAQTIQNTYVLKGIHGAMIDKDGNVMINGKPIDSDKQKEISADMSNAMKIYSALGKGYAVQTALSEYAEKRSAGLPVNPDAIIKKYGGIRGGTRVSPDTTDPLGFRQ